jgi:hypothetical protein
MPITLQYNAPIRGCCPLCWVSLLFDWLISKDIDTTLEAWNLTETMHAACKSNALIIACSQATIYTHGMHQLKPLVIQM